MILIIPGQPVAKGRPRMTRSGHVYTPQKTRDYESLIKKCFYEQNGTKLNGPLELKMKAYFRKPKTERSDLMTKKPDVDNIIKTIDALNGIAFDDDRQIVKATAEKLYGDPRLEIEIREVGYDYDKGSTAVCIEKV